MLYDPSHYERPPLAEEIKLLPRDRDVLRRLAPEPGNSGRRHVAF
jgi:hypothetical protein